MMNESWGGRTLKATLNTANIWPRNTLAVSRNLNAECQILHSIDISQSVAPLQSVINETSNFILHSGRPISVLFPVVFIQISSIST